MRKFRRIIMIITDVFIVLFLIKAPAPIMEGIEQGRISRFEYEKESYTGTVTLWHVAGFKVYSGAVGNLLKEQSKKLSKQHYGVYINVFAMTEKEYSERIARGERADIYSLPLGFEYSDMLLPLEKTNAQNVRSNLLNTGTENGVLYEVPFLYSGYCLVENASMIKTAHEGNIDANSITETANNLKKKKSALCGNELCACLYGMQTPLSEENGFNSGEFAYAFSDFRTVGDSLRRYEQGKGFPVNTYALTNYTDLVQYIAFDKYIDERKLPYAKELLSGLLSDDVQEKLPEMGAYTVVEFDSAEELRDLYKDVALDLFSLYLQPRIPNSFEYRKCRDSLFSDAHDALSGDTDAGKRVKKRVDEICNTK